MNSKLLNKYMSCINSLYSGRMNQFEKQNVNLTLNEYISKVFTNRVEIDLNKNLNFLFKILSLVTLIIQKKGKILFILPIGKKYNSINKKFIKILDKYSHYHISSYIQNKPGILTNYMFVTDKNTTKKNPDLIFIFGNNSNFYYRNIIKESLLMNIPIVNVINYRNAYTDIAYPVLSELKLNNIIFFYFLLTNIIRNINGKNKNINRKNK